MRRKKRTVFMFVNTKNNKNKKKEEIKEEKRKREGKEVNQLCV